MGSAHMPRILRVTALLLIITTIWSRPARADWWDVLAELSGPGPFRGRFGTGTVTVYCSHKDFEENSREGITGPSHNDRWFHLLQDSNAKGPCFFFDLRRYKAKDDSRYLPVGAHIYEGGATYRLWAPLEVGVGIGAIHFNTFGQTTDRWLFDIPRVSFKPLLLIPALQKKRNGGFGFLQVVYRASLIQGELTERNFLPKPGTTFRAKNDLVPSGGVAIDPIAFARLLANR